MCLNPLPLSTIPPRPTFKSEKVRQSVVDEILPRVLKHINQNPNDEEEVAYIRTQLIEAVSEGDGYEACRYLERYYCWSPDMGLAEMLDVSGALFDAQDILVKQWVAENDIRPKMQIGDTVFYRNDEQVPVQIGHVYQSEGRYGLSDGGVVHLHPYEEVEAWKRPNH